MIAPNVVIDIETRPDQELLADQDYLDELDVTIGENKSIKDPFKQKAWQDKQKAAHIQKMALHPTTGRIVCIGIGELRSSEAIVLTDLENEAYLMSEFAERLDEKFHGSRIVCGHNIREFDIPYITVRAAVNDVPLPDWWPYMRDWHNVADIMDVAGRKGKLSEWCRAFGFAAPTVTGEEVLHLSATELSDHCMEDMNATMAILNRFARRYPCLRKKKAAGGVRL